MVILFDFDGVIKDSVSVKSDAFEKLFEKFGLEVSSRVRRHHEANGGMSRYEKLPLYLSWSGLTPTDKLVREYSSHFSQIVKQKVIDSKWVNGVEEFIKKNSNQCNMFVVTATPQLEIEEILETLDISSFFSEVVGAPTKKVDAISKLIMKYNINPVKTVMIGDSMPDYLAASENGIQFILRKTELNTEMQSSLHCKMIDDFTQFRLGI